MARSGATLLVAVALAVMGTLALSFVGSPGAASHNIRGADSKMAMNFFGGEPVTTTPPPAEIIADGTYVIGITAFFFVSVLANANGFFGPWTK